MTNDAPAEPRRLTNAERRARARNANPDHPTTCSTCRRYELDCCDPHEENW